MYKADPANTYEGTPCRNAGHTRRYVKSGACVQCGKDRSKEHTRTHPANRALAAAKNRAKTEGLDFDLTLEDILPIPRVCPVLGIAMAKGMGGHTAASPSLDKIRPELGYTKGNIHWISYRANLIKNNATVGELRMVADYFEQLELSGNGIAFER